MAYKFLEVGGSAAEIYDLSGTTTVANDFTVNANGTLAGSADLTVNGRVTGLGVVTLSGGTLEQRLVGNDFFGHSSSSNIWTVNNLTFSNSGVTTRNARIHGTGLLVINGTLTVGKATDSGVIVMDDETNDRVIDVNGNVVIDTNGTMQASSTAAFTVAGSWTNSGGTFTPGTGRVTFDAGSANKTITAGASAFYNVTLNNASGEWELQSATTSPGPGRSTAATATTPARPGRRRSAPREQSGAARTPSTT
jgi:hypothetical protein